MDAYLNIAQAVLRSERRPLTPRAILAIAYRAGIVSHRLYGKTQHKTLGARLSEDLVIKSEHSLFFRTEPGKYFLREFLADSSIPEEFRTPVPTRRRIRELIQGPTLSFDFDVLSQKIPRNLAISPDEISQIIKDDMFFYDSGSGNDPNSVRCVAFVCVKRKHQTLTFRAGRYREDRDAFRHKRCIGFSTPVYASNYHLFTQNDLGIVEAGVDAVRMDLDIPNTDVSDENRIASAKLSHFIWIDHPSSNALLAIITFDCPSWFEPTKRRLALNDLGWLDDIRHVNNIADFDPWSQEVIRAAERSNAQTEKID